MRAAAVRHLPLGAAAAAAAPRLRRCFTRPQQEPQQQCATRPDSGSAAAARLCAAAASSQRRRVAAASTASGASTGSSSNNGAPASTPAAAATATGAPAPPPPGDAAGSVLLKPLYVAIFAAVFAGGMLFAIVSLQLTSDLGFGDAVARITRRVFRSIAFRQLLLIAGAMLVVRFALNNVLRLLARWSSSPVPWDKSRVYYVMRELYAPLELLLFVAGCCTIADAFLPQLVQVPKATVNAVVRAALSMSFILGAATAVFNLKSRFCKEQAWQMEMQGNVTSQRRWEAYDKLGTFAIYALTFFLAIQALGLEVRSVLAIGGVGGLAIGLAGREILENLLNGFLLMTTMPFEVGEEVVFSPNGQVRMGGVWSVGRDEERVGGVEESAWGEIQATTATVAAAAGKRRQYANTTNNTINNTIPLPLKNTLTPPPQNTKQQLVEGIVLDVGWYRTTIRSFEREVFVIPNAVFSKNTVLNVTRKMREWRFYEMLSVRVADVHKVNAIVQDIRRIVRNDARIINKLHRRIFLDKITHDDCKIYLSFYVEASNRDAFMAVKQDLLLAFVDCVERNGAKLATPRAVLELEDPLSPAFAGMYSGAAAAAAAAATRFKLLPAGPVAGGGGVDDAAGAPAPAIDVTGYYAAPAEDAAAAAAAAATAAPATPKGNGSSSGSGSKSSGGDGKGGDGGGSSNGSSGSSGASSSSATVAATAATAAPAAAAPAAAPAVAKDAAAVAKEGAATAAAAAPKRSDAPSPSAGSGGGSGSSASQPQAAAGSSSGSNGSSSKSGASSPQPQPQPLAAPAAPRQVVSAEAAAAALDGAPVVASTAATAAPAAASVPAAAAAAAAAAATVAAAAAAAAAASSSGAPSKPAAAPSGGAKASPSSSSSGSASAGGSSGGGGGYKVVTTTVVQAPPSGGAGAAASQQPQRDVIMASFEEL